MSEQDKVEGVFSLPQRQHVLGVFRYFTRNAWLLIRSFWPALAGLAISDSVRMYTGLVSVIVLIGLCAFAALEHWRFTFKIDAGSLIIERGILERERLVIPLDRIQTVHTEELFWHRFFSLVGLRIDTAGSSGAEVELTALKKDQASLLIDVLSSAHHEPKAEVAPLIQLDWEKLFRIGLTQNHLRNAMISFGAVVAVAEPLMEWVEQALDSLPTVWIWAFKFAWIFAVPLFGLFFLFTGLLVSLLGALLRYHRLTVRLTSSHLEMKGGFLKKFEFKLPLHKIQMLEGKSGILQRLAGFQTVKIHQARSQSNADAGGVNVVIPGLSREEMATLNSGIYKEDCTSEALRLKPHSIWWVRRAVLFIAWSTIPLFLWPNFLVVLFAFAWAAWSIYSSAMLHRQMCLIVMPSELIFRSGWRVQLSRRIELRKLQRVTLRANWFMRKKGVSNVVLLTAAGPLTLPYVPLFQAKELRDKALFEIESTQVPWM